MRRLILGIVATAVLSSAPHRTGRTVFALGSAAYYGRSGGRRPLVVTSDPNGQVPTRVWELQPGERGPSERCDS